MALPTANNVNHPQAWGYGASLDNGGGAPTDKLYLRLADSPDRVSGIQTVPAENKIPNTAQQAEDIRSGAGSIFSRTQFSGGEGLDRAHRAGADERFDATRYWDSRNIKIEPARPGYPEELTLLFETSSWRTSTNTNHFMARIGTVLYWAEGSDVKRTANPTAGTPTVTSEDPEAGGTPTAISGLTALGDELYAAIGAEGIHKRNSAGTWAHWSDLDCSGSKIWSVKDRIIAASGTGLYEAGALATSTLLETLPSGQTWLDVVDAGTVILACASNGSLYAWSDESGTLVLRNVEDFEGEVPYALGMSQGVLFVGTGQTTTGGGKIGRLWIAEVVGFRIRNAQVVREWGTGSETRDRAPRCFLPTRDSMFFAVIEDGSETHLWRFHLATAGLTRDLIFAESAEPQGCAVFDDRIFVSFNANDIYREDTTYATSGWLIGPLADHFTAEPKTQVGIRLDAEVPITQETITLHYSTDPDALLSASHGSWVSLISWDLNTTAATIASEQPLTGVESRYLTTKITLTPSTDQTTAPTVFSVAQRSLLPSVDLALRIFVNVSDTIKRFGRKPVRVPEQGKRIWEELRDNWIDKHLEVELFRPSIKVRGQIINVSTPLQGRTKRGDVQVYSVIDVQGIKVT